MQQLKKMGPLGNLLGMMPGMPKELKGAEIDDDDLKPVEAIIRSMTPEERAQPQMINGSRRTRIANGSGTSPSDVNRLVKQFSEMQKMMKRFGMPGWARARRASAAPWPACPRRRDPRPRRADRARDSHSLIGRRGSELGANPTTAGEMRPGSWRKWRPDSQLDVDCRHPPERAPAR